jgi:hypothetical protein
VVVTEDVPRPRRSRHRAGVGTFPARLADLVTPKKFRREKTKREKLALARVSLRTCSNKKIMNATPEWSVPDTQLRTATLTKNDAFQPAGHTLFP